ncbi:MAG: RNA 3'-terminal phosphate cyclase [Candidatus Omnitrophica bacterium]|nr:RNA 3'-terminal phosphate cyclase [Candidatus Omnitrophota bacterium]
MLTIDGSHLEGGGQILRTSLALSTILNQEVEIINIRKNRKNSGLAEQHLRIIEAFKDIFGARSTGDTLSSQTIKFYPSQEAKDKYIKITPQTSASCGLIMQAVLPALYFLDKRITLEISGGTAGKWAPPFDFYPYIVFPVLGVEAKIEIKRRGYYPKGGGLVTVEFKKFSLKRIELFERGKLEQIQILSFASSALRAREVASRQSAAASDELEEKIKGKHRIKKAEEYFDTLSIGSELSLCAQFSTGCLLWADALGQIEKPAQAVGQEAAEKLIGEIESGACCDIHLADNLIPYLAFVGGVIKTSKISQHTLTNIWVCEQFLGEIFQVKDNAIKTNI